MAVSGAGVITFPVVKDCEFFAEQDARGVGDHYKEARLSWLATALGTPIGVFIFQIN
jgi:hypothetical protein